MNLSYLFAAYSLIWLALALFLWRLVAKINRLQREVDILREQK